MYHIGVCILESYFSNIRMCMCVCVCINLNLFLFGKTNMYFVVCLLLYVILRDRTGGLLYSLLVN